MRASPKVKPTAMLFPEEFSKEALVTRLSENAQGLLTYSEFSGDQALTSDDAPEALKRLIGAYAGASLFRESMEIRLIESGGPITTKGRTRALFTAYLAALDR